MQKELRWAPQGRQHQIADCTGSDELPVMAWVGPPTLSSTSKSRLDERSLSLMSSDKITIVSNRRKLFFSTWASRLFCNITLHNGN